ncbi:MAG: SH3 domain-containing protein [Spirulinaceae cyanobacterium]
MSNLSKSFALATALSLAAIAVSATEAMAVYCAKIEVARGPLNVRSGPGTAFRDVGNIPKDSIVRVEERNNVPTNDPNWKWLRISMYETLAGNAVSSPGWISSDFVGPGFACQSPLARKMGS